MKHTIYLSLTDVELEKLKNIISTKESNSISNLLKLLIYKENQDEYIKHNVYLSLADISGFDVEDFNDESDLKFDLGLSTYHKKALRNYFQRIIKELGSIKIITVKECEVLTKVSDCLKLVKSKI